MRDFVEIGVGREARRSYDLDQISILPSRRTRSSKDVNTCWQIDAYSFDIPLLNQPTDALASPEFCIEMGAQGGLGVFNAEGIFARHVDPAAAIAKVAAAENPTAVLQELHAAPIDHDLLAERIAQIRAAGGTVAVRVSPQRARELAPVVIKAGAELLVIQGTMISAEHVEKDGTPLNLKEFVGTLDVPVIAGGVTSGKMAMHLMRSGVAGIIVGSGATTSDLALGINPGQATALADCAAARREYLDETGGRYVHIIAGGEIYTAGDIVKSIALGADAVMLGQTLAAADEAAGQGLYWESVAAHPRYPRGFVYGLESKETVPLATLLHGPSDDPAGTVNLVGGLRRSVAKCGYVDLKNFQKVELLVH